MLGPFDLLIVDDDPAQIELIRVTVKELRLDYRVHHASEGAAALDFLHRRGPFQDAPRPDLILLDLNMPVMSGADVLRQIKSDSQLRTIPVVILSSSQSASDIETCYGEHANAYITKPMDLEGNFRVVRELDHFWFGVVHRTK